MDFFKQHVSLIVALVLAVILFGGYYILFSPPQNFSSGNIVIIAQGASAPNVAKELFDAHIIAHPSLLRLLLRLSDTSGRIQAGAYRFETPQNLFIVWYRIVTGEYGLPLVRITIPEGTTLSGMAAQIATAFPEISAPDFSKAASQYEGYLFPDTYFFPPGTDSTTILTAMRANFESKTAPLTGAIQISGYSFSDTVILASLIEKEARTNIDKRIIAGILLNRLSRGMPLQVDAARDTYKHTGLPPSPICNPGLDSIEAVLQPTKTNYLYYLTGNDGLMHYATTFAGHEANLRKYLD